MLEYQDKILSFSKQYIFGKQYLNFFTNLLMEEKLASVRFYRTLRSEFGRTKPTANKKSWHDEISARLTRFKLTS